MAYAIKMQFDVPSTKFVPYGTNVYRAHQIALFLLFFWIPFDTWITSIICIFCSFISGTTPLRQVLRKDAVPSIFPWTQPETPVSRARASRVSKRRLSMEFLPTTDDSGSAEVVISSGGLDVAEVVVEHVEENEPIPDPENARAPPMSIACQTDCPRGLVTIEHIQDNDIQMAMMTGLENYRKFSYVLQSWANVDQDLCCHGVNKKPECIWKISTKHNAIQVICCFISNSLE